MGGGTGNYVLDEKERVINGEYLNALRKAGEPLGFYCDGDFDIPEPRLHIVIPTFVQINSSCNSDSEVVFSNRDGENSIYIIPFKRVVGLWDLPPNGFPGNNDLRESYRKKYIYDKAYIGSGSVMELLESDESFRGYAKALKGDDFKIKLNWFERTMSKLGLEDKLRSNPVRLI